MRLLPPRVVAALAPHLLNTHPAYLPEFPGAHAVRDALAAGATETGASVIVVDNGVDSGPIVAQRRIPMLPGDTEAACTTASSSSSASCSSQTVLDIATTARPGDTRVSSAPRPRPGYRDRDLIPIRRALISVYDKTGLLELAAALARQGVEIVSTGSTAQLIADAGHRGHRGARR